MILTAQSSVIRMTWGLREPEISTTGINLRKDKIVKTPETSSRDRGVILDYRFAVRCHIGSNDAGANCSLVLWRSVAFTDITRCPASTLLQIILPRPSCCLGFKPAFFLEPKDHHTGRNYCCAYQYNK